MAVSLAYVMIGPPSVWAANINRFFHGGYPFPANIGLFIGAVCLGFVIPVQLAVSLGVAWPVPVLSARRRNLTDGLVVGLAVGLPVGLGVGLGVGLATGLTAGLTFGLAAGLTAGLTSAMGIGTDSWLPDTSLASPMSALAQELVAGLVAGLVSGLAIGLGVGLLAGLVFVRAGGLVFGLAFGLTAGLSVGLRISVAWGRYIIGRAASTAQRCLPPRLSSFLTWACDSGLLRVSGATYQFRHRELQDWLYPPDVTDKAHVTSDP